jgi:hypothetical protein
VRIFRSEQTNPFKWHLCRRQTAAPAMLMLERSEDAKRQKWQWLKSSNLTSEATSFSGMVEFKE